MEDNNTKELEEKVESLEKEIEDLKDKPYRCSVCGKPTNGWLRVLFWTRYYCEEHFPPGGYSACW